MAERTTRARGLVRSTRSTHNSYTITQSFKSHGPMILLCVQYYQHLSLQNRNGVSCQYFLRRSWSQGSLLLLTYKNNINLTIKYIIFDSCKTHTTTRLLFPRHKKRLTLPSLVTKNYNTMPKDFIPDIQCI